MSQEPVDFERLSREHRRSVLSYAFLCCRDLHVAEDIVQETMTIAFEKRAQYFPEANFGAWLISIARNVWFRERDRRKIDSRATPFLEEHAIHLLEEGPHSEERWEEESRALRRCLGKLAPTDQMLIRDHLTERRKYRELAALHARTVAWVKVRMHRARLALLDCVRRTLSEEGRTG